MKEKDITKEVIKLSKQIAEHWRMEIYEGCWYVHKSGDGAIQLHNFGMKTMSYDYYGLYSLLPIPSISDCLEKLQELEIEPDILIDAHGIAYLKYGDPLQMYVHDTLHRALLSALLEVLKEEGQQP